MADGNFNDEWSEDDFLLIPDSAPVKFDSGEHADIPSECYIRFSSDPKKPALSGKAATEEAVLCYSRKRKEFPLTFANTIALAGDFYVFENPKGDYTSPVSYGPTFKERVERMRSAVLNLKTDEGNIMEQGSLNWAIGVPGLDQYLQREMSMVEQHLADLPENAKDNPENKGVHNITHQWKNYSG
ncbi:MAG: hypothetical protein Q9190_000815 [Brigantiaea leucoxantha]